MFPIKLQNSGLLTKKRLLWLLAAVLLIVVLVVLTAHDEGLYKTTIVKVTAVTVTYEKTGQGPNMEEEKYYTQDIRAVIQNGQYKGQTVTLQNEYAQSQIKTEKYTKGERLFVELSGDQHELKATVSGVKRDTYLVLLVSLTVLSLLLVTSGKGFLTVVSLVANSVLFVVWISVNGKTLYDPQNWILLVVGFCVVTLALVSGLHRKTWAAILASLGSIALIYGIYQLTAAYTPGLPFELVEYMTGPDSAEPVFVISVIVGSLGAIMDVAITICSSVSELTAGENSITMRELIASIREIAMDIMGTMINVLFFSYLSGALFKIVIMLKNGYSLFSLFHFNFVFEVVRFLAGSIGIVLTIPLSALIAIAFFRKRIIPPRKAGEV